MRRASERVADSAEKTVRDIRRATRRRHSAEDKIRIVLEGLRGEGSIAAAPGARSRSASGRTAADFAVCMRELADLHYPRAKRIRVVLDNLSTHSPGALYHTFPPDGPIAYSLCLFH